MEYKKIDLSLKLAVLSIDIASPSLRDEKHINVQMHWKRVKTLIYATCMDNLVLLGLHEILQLQLIWSLTLS